MSVDVPDSVSIRRALRWGGLAIAIVAVAVVAVGITARANNDRELRRWTDEQAITTVSVVNPAPAAGSKSLDLPGRFEAYANAPLYARVNGYLKRWYADIGTPVKAGQLLAEIDTPDLDQQLAQARADVASAKANAELAGVTARRLQGLLESNSVSRQEVDERTGDFASKQALLQSAQANLDRLQATKAFARIVAPFDGIVTARSTDVGALIDVGGGTGPALFTVSDVRKLRLYVNVPQSYVASIKNGDEAAINVPEQPDKPYSATVASSSRAVDAASGTTLMQLTVDNRSGELLPGGYAKVSFALKGQRQTLSIPSSALIFNNAGLRVATVDAQGKVQLKNINIARDLGKELEIDSGLNADDQVIDNPPDGLAAGDPVRIQAKPGATPPSDGAQQETKPKA